MAALDTAQSPSVPWLDNPVTRNEALPAESSRVRALELFTPPPKAPRFEPLQTKTRLAATTSIDSLGLG